MSDWPDPLLAGGPLKSSEVCFVGRGTTGPCWYRCALPAMWLGTDWTGLVGEPGKYVRHITGLVRGESRAPDLGKYKVVVLQQPGFGWAPVIEQLQERGVTVLFELDDHLRSIRKMRSHEYHQGFTLKLLKELEDNQRRCDGMIVSTDYLARWARQFNDRVWVCQNGLDLGRYRLTRPERATVNIGWAGATGHERIVKPWMETTVTLMTQRPNTNFVSIGQGFAEGFKHAVGNDRALSVPFTMIDQYPAAMTLFDIAIAPAGHTPFFLAKSDLRFLEAGALGIPVVASRHVYGKTIEDGVTGFLADERHEIRDRILQLVDEPELRTSMGEAAREYVLRERGMGVAARAWERALSEALVD